MSFQEKKRIQIIVVVIVGIIVFAFGFIRIQKKISSIMKTSDFQNFKVDLEIPELNIPDYPSGITTKETEETIDDITQEELEELLNEEINK